MFFMLYSFTSRFMYTKSVFSYCQADVLIER